MHEHSAPIPSTAELLSLNYANLHASMQSAHIYAWTATSVFVPVALTLQGALIKEYPRLTWLGVLLGALVVQGLLLTWLVMTELIRHYNRQRIARLKDIEKAARGECEPPQFSHYTCFDYGMRIALPRKSRFSLLRITPHGLYRRLFCACLILNVVLVWLRALEIPLATP